MATRMQQRRGTASQWTSANPVLNAAEMGWESDTNKFKIGDGVNHWADLDYFIDANSTANPAFGSSITFEGATANDYETVIQVTDPTADRTITFPDATGTVALTADIAELSQDAIDSALVAGTGITKTYNDGANTLTLAVDTTTIQARVTDVSDTEIGYLNGVTSGIQTQIDGKLALSGGTMTGSIAMGTNKITGVGTPTDSTDATTKAYVDAVTEGLHIHPSVVAATTDNINLSTDVENGDTLDGVTLSTGDRILVKNQSTESQNGIYVVAASGAPSRAIDFDSPAEIDGGDFVFVVGGTVNDNTGYVQVNTVGTVGTDAIAFTQFSGAGTFLAGNGLTLTGNTFSINTAITSDLSTAQTLTNKTLTSPKVNEDVVMLATSTELNILDGATLSTTELNYVDGVTSAIQTQLDAKIAKTDISAKGAILVGTGTGTYTAQTVGSNGQVLTANSAQSDGVEWTTISGYSAPTLGSTSIASGATVTSISGLTLASPTVTGGTLTDTVVRGLEEDVNIVAAAATGTINFDVATASIWYYTSNATANHTLNFRYSSGVTLNTALAIGDAITLVWMNTNGGSAFYPNVIQIDGVTRTPRVPAAITAGNTNSIDVYSFTIIKTADATFTVLETQGKFA